MDLTEQKSILRKTKKPTIRKEKETEKGKEKRGKRRPWRQVVRHNAKQKRKAEEERDGKGLESAVSENDVGNVRKKNKLSKEKRTKRKREFAEGGKSGTTEADTSTDGGDRSLLLSSVDASRFRFLNEQLCSQTSTASAKFFEDDPDSFRLYHQGYRQQVSKWPVNPLEKIVLDLGSLPSGSVVADLGCGEAEIAKRLGTRFRVHSFDLAAPNERVLVADMAKLPLEAESVDVCVYCLSLMGTNLAQFFREAHRVLKMRGKVKIAEIASRFRSVSSFVSALQKMGFQMKRKKLIGDGFFVLMTLEKVSKKVANKRPKNLRLLPFLYKKR